MLSRNTDAISCENSSPQKCVTWKHMYDILIKAGMPKTSVDRVKKSWSRLQYYKQTQSY